MNDTITNNDSTLIINLNEEYKIKIEKGKDFNTSIFKEVYEAALKNVEEIVNQSSKNGEYDDFNNIIAFTGERGKGKSSSMISFRDALVHENTIDTFFTKNEIVSKKKFVKINIIDPSLFRGEESLFEIILAQMFQEFQLEIKKTDSKLGDDERRSIIKHFQEVYENLQIINSDRKDLYKKDSIEALSRLATSSNLRACFRELVMTYLEKFEKINKNEGFLIIAIDDFDLNISGAFDMLEDIRQFLIQSNIILLVACKMEQLHEVVQLYHKENKIENLSDVKAKKYIDKIFPFERRISLPDVRSNVQGDFKIVTSSNELFSTKNKSFNISILKLLFDKSKIFQPLNLLRQNPIIPETIRQTHNLCSVIYSDNNVQNLKNYLIDEIQNDKKLYSDVLELESFSDDIFLLLLNKKLLKIYSNINKGNDHLISLSKQYKVLNSANIPGRIGIGDIVYILKECEDVLAIDDYYMQNYIGYLKLYITLRIKLFKKQDADLFRYGFYNIFYDVLAKEGNKNNRDYIQYNTKDLHELFEFKELNTDELLIFSLWHQYIGVGYLDYRSSKNKDIFIKDSLSNVISPFALLHTCSIMPELSTYFNININDSRIAQELNEWVKDSSFFKQLSNPSFVLKLIEYIKDFRTLEVKESLPDNYYDTVCLLFNYGIFYALDKIQKEYNIDGLVRDYLNNPVFREMIIYFNSKDPKYRVVSELNKTYIRELEYFFDKYFFMHQNIAFLINALYDKSKVEKNENSKDENLNDITIQILKDLKWELENNKITSKLVGNRAKKIEGNQKIVDTLNSLKYKLNKTESYDPAKNEIINYIDSLLNG